MSVKEMMDKENERLESIGKNPFIVPEGYFENLKERLNAIPSSHEAPVRRSFRERTTPYVALAACFAASLVIGTAILKHTAANPDLDPESLELYSSLMYSDFTTSSLLAYEEEPEVLSEEDIIHSLIASGASVEALEYSALTK